MTLRKFTIPALVAALLLCAVSLSAQEYVQGVGVNASQTEFTVNVVSPDAFLLEISGPADYYWRGEVEDEKELTVTNTLPDGRPMVDGSYTLQVTPIFKLSDEQREALKVIRENQDEAALQTFRELHQLPSRVERYTVYYRIVEGKFADPNLKEIQDEHLAYQWDHQARPQFIDPPATFASITEKRVQYAKRVLAQAEPIALDNTPMAEDAQVFVTDVVVQGSICVGFDCVNGESFGFDTQRLKENNLRIHFQDTSNSASFPSQDWGFTANDSTNGGGNYLGIADRTSGRIPFRVEANAPSNALYVDDAGNVGLGTATPVVEMHVKDGDSPTMRLEQDGSSGFTAQTWDIASNESNFFVRDVTNGSTLPFRIQPSAPTNSIYIKNNGHIGLGTNSPEDKLHLKTSGGIKVDMGDVYLPDGAVGINTESAPDGTNALEVVGNFDLNGKSTLTGELLLSGDATFLLSNVRFIDNSFSDFMKLDATNGYVGIGEDTPTHLLHLGDDDAVKPGGGSWSEPSDRRLKEDIRNFNDGLEVLMNIRPVRYRFNGKMNMPTDKEYIGIIAQEMQKIAPYTIRQLNKSRKGENQTEYLAFNDAPLTYVTINAIQEQQAIIEAQQQEINALKAQLTEMEQLKAQMEALSAAVNELKTQTEQEKASGATLQNAKK